VENRQKLWKARKSLGASLVASYGNATRSLQFWWSGQKQAKKAQSVENSLITEPDFGEIGAAQSNE
jgi:hypothetical protein